MRSGLGYPSALAGAAAVDTGGTAANYPPAGALDLTQPSRVVRSSGATYLGFGITLAASSVVQFLAVVGHNLDASGIVRARLYAGADPNPATNGGAAPVYDTGNLALFPVGGPSAFYPSTRPIILPAPVTARSVLFEFNNSSAILTEVGGVEVGAWWEWVGIAPGAENGVASVAEDVGLVGGVLRGSEDPAPRIFNGSVPYARIGAVTDRMLDFQRDTQLDKPFVFVLDADAPATWPRSAWLARNVQVPALVGVLYRHDRFQFRFTEHMG